MTLFRTVHLSYRRDQSIGQSLIFEFWTLPFRRDCGKFIENTRSVTTIINFSKMRHSLAVCKLKHFVFMHSWPLLDSHIPRPHTSPRRVWNCLLLCRICEMSSYSLWRLSSMFRDSCVQSRRISCNELNVCGCELSRHDNKTMSARSEKNRMAWWIARSRRVGHCFVYHHCVDAVSVSIKHFRILSARCGIIKQLVTLARSHLLASVVQSRRENHTHWPNSVRKLVLLHFSGEFC